MAVAHDGTTVSPSDAGICKIIKVLKRHHLVSARRTCGRLGLQWRSGLGSFTERALLNAPRCARIVTGQCQYLLSRIQ